ncbi:MULTISPECIES: MFS transporter [Sphingobium]|uniref:Major facilitator superfamily (MFS) profile domain-containing protein n=1 Tax=Sphingobium xenophagum TaxID=121428 RepID=A0A401J8M5_SPHXE|nr:MULTISPECIES: MFS transporter [Sphingobium]MBG6120285.1 benzoate transport [Sphingobium sp. JAI105]PSO11022.1 MFS transporter [Sphingobium sp. AEW4]TWD05521.1 benzoate transport [Sphingobium sp. AEW010]TWD22406.1 benzoate transport [Sphingobium sp. AEW013]TWD25051.1 benzoate transport [Sphingobium sp. AEW001]
MAEQATDLRRQLDEAPMGRLQIIAIILCVLLNALDGFDVLAISFASPGIAKEWGVDRAALGLVLSMELIGMAVGSVLLGNVADRIGRRPTIIFCLIVMALGMGAATQAWDVISLSIIRLATGLGIGGMLACTNAMVAELANARARSLAVAIMAAGYPAGAILGGSVASQLLVAGNWRDIFLLGGIATALFLPFIWFLLPESIGFLLQKRPANALSRINDALGRLGQPLIDALPPVDAGAPKASFAALFAPGLARTTILLTLAYFCHIMTFYFILKWVPKIVVDMGYAPSAAGGVLVWANVGGLLGALLLSALSWRIAIRPLVIIAMVASTCLVTLFGQEQTTLPGLSLIAAAAGFCTNGAVVGLYALVAQSFPTAVRAGGTGIVIGVGRGGAALGPILAGLLFSLDVSLPWVAFAMALGSLIGAGLLIPLRPRPA